MQKNKNNLIKPIHLCRGKAQSDLLIDSKNDNRSKPLYTGIKYVQKVDAQ